MRALMFPPCKVGNRNKKNNKLWRNYSFADLASPPHALLNLTISNPAWCFLHLALAPRRFRSLGLALQPCSIIINMQTWRQDWSIFQLMCNHGDKNGVDFNSTFSGLQSPHDPEIVTYARILLWNHICAKNRVYTESHNAVAQLTYCLESDARFSASFGR